MDTNRLTIPTSNVLKNTENGPLGLVGHYALENSRINFVWQIGLFRNIALSKFVRF